MAVTTIHGGTQIRIATITADRFVASLNLPTAQLQDGAKFIQRDGSVPFTANQPMGGFKFTNMANGSAATDGATYGQLAAVAAGIATRRARVVSVANVGSLTGLPTADSVTLVAGEIILLTAQTTASQNGPWVVAAGAWTRPSDWGTGTAQKSTIFFVEEGTLYHDSRWNLITDAITVDTTNVTLSQDTGGGTYTADTTKGIALTGGAFSAKVGNGNYFDGSGNIATLADPTANNIAVIAGGVKIKDGTSAQILLANSGGVFGAATVTGDVTISNTGVTTINTTAGSGFLKQSNFVANETLGGTVDGSNAVFTLANTPQGGSAMIYRDGVLLTPGAGNDYTISGTNVTFLTTMIPVTGDTPPKAYYWK